jgi:hypothetical protein
MPHASTQASVLSVEIGFGWVGGGGGAEGGGGHDNSTGDHQIVQTVFGGRGIIRGVATDLGVIIP